MTSASTPARPATLKKRSEFLHVMSGARFRGPLFLLGVAANDRDEARIGYTVSKRQGNSVQRNRIKRRLRAAVLDQSGAFLAGHDHVLTASAEVLDTPFETLRAELARRLAKARRQTATPIESQD